MSTPTYRGGPCDGDPIPAKLLDSPMISRPYTTTASTRASLEWFQQYGLAEAAARALGREPHPDIPPDPLFLVAKYKRGTDGDFHFQGAE